jgi:hypothetical protein
MHRYKRGKAKSGKGGKGGKVKSRKQAVAIALMGKKVPKEVEGRPGGCLSPESVSCADAHLGVQGFSEDGSVIPGSRDNPVSLVAARCVAQDRRARRVIRILLSQVVAFAYGERSSPQARATSWPLFARSKVCHARQPRENEGALTRNAIVLFAFLRHGTILRQHR